VKKEKKGGRARDPYVQKPRLREGDHGMGGQIRRPGGKSGNHPGGGENMHGKKVFFAGKVTGRREQNLKRVASINTISKKQASPVVMRS